MANLFVKFGLRVWPIRDSSHNIGRIAFFSENEIMQYCERKTLRM